MLENRINTDGVIFDLDGTLLDSVPVMFRMLNLAFQRLELPGITTEEAVVAAKDGYFDWDRVLPPMDGPGKDALILKAQEIIAEIQPEIMREEARLIPGVSRILELISAAGIRIGLVTTTQRVFLEHKLYHLERAGIDHLFETIITVDDVKRRKPAPDPLYECAGRLGIPVESTVHVGDSRVDIRAGKAAGARTVGVLTGMDDYDTLARERPDAVIESVLGLREILVFDRTLDPGSPDRSPSL